jgi:predicted transcriptional regulator
MAKRPRIPEAEGDVLAVLHRLGEATARQVREALASERPMVHATAVTLLRRLEARGFVTRRKGDQGKAFVYSPELDRSTAFGPVVSRLLRQAFRDRPAALLTALFQTRPPTRTEIDELETLLKGLRRGLSGLR